MTSQATAAPTRSSLRTWLRWLLALVVFALALLFAAYYVLVVYPAGHIPALEQVDGTVYLDQGWGTTQDSPQRQAYYYTPQGTSMPQGALVTPLRYRWFTALEMPLSTQAFAAPEHLMRYRFIVDPKPSAANPDRLPLGFTRHYDPALGEDVLDLTCAACHSGEIHARRNGKTYAVRIDGGQAMHAFTDMEKGAFGPTLVASMAATLVNPMKFDRFARKVIGPRYPQGKWALREDLAMTIRAFATQGQNDPLKHLYPVREGYGRTDALGRIANTVFGDHLVGGNYQQGDAPVSYPYVWNIWKFDWVQYNGSVSQPLARNIGESLGVGAVIRMTDNYGNALPPEHRFDSSVDIENLGTIEHTLQTLRPPRWPEQLLGAIDQAKAAKGRVLFEQHCEGCHGPHPVDRAQQLAQAPGKPGPETEWHIEVIPVEHIGTDPTEANGFINRHYDLRATGITQNELVALLQPQMLRNLARDARWRLGETIDGRARAGLSTGALPTLLAEYPDPDANEVPAIPHASFLAIAAELHELPPPASTNDPWNCDANCQQAALLADVSTGERQIGKSLAALDLGKLTEGEGLNVLGMMIKRKYFAERKIPYAQQQCMEGFGILDLPQQVAGYKPRPLEGVWATPPFLHNGSVPTIYQMLLPPDQRDRTFGVGSRLYDPKHLGFVTTPVDGGFTLDTSLTGNRNTGHAFTATPAQLAAAKADPKGHPLPSGVIGPLLTDEQRYAILEYLKVHRDEPATPASFQPPVCAP